VTPVVQVQMRLVFEPDGAGPPEWATEQFSLPLPVGERAGWLHALGAVLAYRYGAGGDGEARLDELVSAGVRVEPVTDPTVRITAEADGEPAACRVQFRTDCLDRQHARRLAGHLAQLAGQARRDPRRRIRELPMLADDEYTRILCDPNPPSIGVPGETAYDMVAAAARRAPEQPAIVYEGTTWTYRELLVQVSRWARALAAAGVRTGDVVGVCLQRSPDLVAALLGVLGAGGAYLPLDPAYPTERLRYMAGDAALRVIATQESLSQLTDQFGAQVVRVGREDLPPAAAESFAQRRPPIDTAPAVVIYTSGSTGRPKGVVIPHRALSNFLPGMSARLGMTAADRVLAHTPLSFDISILELIAPLTLGASVRLVDRATATDGQALAEAIKRAGATVVQGTPTTHRMLLAAGWVPDPDQTLVSGGEPLPSDVAAQLTSRGARLWNSYGPTETTVYTHSTLVEPGVPIRLAGPLPNLRTYLLDADGNPVPVGVAGEICLGGEGLASGYLDRPALTAERFRPDPFASRPGARLYRSGDLARWTGEGRLHLLGRADQQVKLRGYRIEPGEIEAVLRGDERVADALVAVDTEGTERLLVARVVLTGAGRPSRDDLAALLSSRLPRYMIPARFVEVDTLPLTASGKVDRAAAARLEGRVLAGGDRTEPRDPVEQVVAGVWLDLLGADDLGVHEPVLDLGATSLMVMRAAALLSEIFDVAVPVRELFDRPSVVAQADYVRSGCSDASGTAEALLRLATEAAVRG
jgi:amino acid adenylation domain-containing protein